MLFLFVGESLGSAQGLYPALCTEIIPKAVQRVDHVIPKSNPGPSLCKAYI